MKATLAGVPEFYTPAEVAQGLRVTRRTVYAWIKNGELQAIKVGPRELRVTPQQINAFLARRQWVEQLQEMVKESRPGPGRFVEVEPVPVPVPQVIEPPPLALKPEPNQRSPKKGRRR
jgi:excisionase family DNA binding protein